MVPTILLFHKNVNFALPNITENQPSEFSFQRSNLDISFANVTRKEKISKKVVFLAFERNYLLVSVDSLFMLFSTSPKQLFDKTVYLFIAKCKVIAY